MARIEKTRTVKVSMFFLRAYLIFLFGLIICKGVGLLLAKDTAAGQSKDPAPAAAPARPGTTAMPAVETAPKTP